MSAANTAASGTGGWYDTFSKFGASVADTLSETLSLAAQLKLQEKATTTALAQQRANDTSTNQDVQAATNPVKGVDADGGTLVQKSVSVGGVSIQHSTLKTAGFVVGGLLLGAVAFKYLKGK